MVSILKAASKVFDTRSFNSILNPISLFANAGARHCRILTNNQQLVVNAPRNPVTNHWRDCTMAFGSNYDAAPNCESSSHAVARRQGPCYVEPALALSDASKVLILQPCLYVISPCE